MKPKCFQENVLPLSAKMIETNFPSLQKKTFLLIYLRLKL